MLGITTEAATLIVTTNSDDGSAGTLRTTVQNSAAHDVINFDPSLSGSTILLTNGQIALNQSLTIDASALSGGISIDGDTNSGIFLVASTANVVLDSLTLTNAVGAYTGNGGAIDNEGGTLTLNRCTVSGNSATTPYGGGIFNSGDLTLNQCTVANNSTVGGQGGGIYNWGGTATATLNQSTVSGNSAIGGSGGGIYSDFGFLFLNQCTVCGNSAGDTGGGLCIYYANLAMDQSTISGNYSVSNGGGFDGEGAILDITNSIIAGNDAGTSTNADIYLYNSSELDFGGSNIVEALENSGGTSTISGPAPIDADPRLQPLGNYGGPTETMLPIADSPAVDGGSDSATNLYTTDQRGFPLPSGLHVDIGAVELQQATVATLLVTNVTGTNAIVEGTVTPNDLETTWEFAYGPTTNYGFQTQMITAEPGFSPVMVSNLLTSLAPLSTYHYALVAYDGVSTKVGSDATFNTTIGAPSVSTAGATYSTTNATLSATFNPDGVDTQYYFEYGPTPDYGFYTETNMISATNGSVDVSAMISGLSPDTMYYFQLVTSNSIGLGNSVPDSFTSGQILVVTTNSDDGSPGSLRTVVGSASSGDAIVFTNTLSGSTIVLTNGRITLDDIVLDGSALTGGIVIDGDTNQIFEVYGQVTLNSIVISNGFISNGSAAGILNFGSLTMNQCTVISNSASQGQGSGIYNTGPLTMNQCTFTGNSASQGGGIYNGGPLTMNQCAFTGNSASQGGGIYNGGTLTMNQCTFSGNDSLEGQGAAIYNGGTLAIEESTLAGNDSGGGQGSAIYNGYELALVQSTVAGNSDGGAICNFGTALVTNSIIAGNGDDVDIANFSGLTFGGSNNVQSIQNNGTVSGPAPISAAAELEALGNYGGPTQTMPPLPGSPVVDAGSDAASAFSTDQRGYPRISGLRVDIGAVELQQATLSTLAASDISATNADGNGTVTPNDLATAWYFEYGTTTNYGSFSATNTLPASFSPASITNALGALAPATLYHFQLLANDGVSVKQGGDETFTTVDAEPSAITEAATTVQETNATLNATVNPNGLLAQYYFQYGPTTNYGSFTATNTLSAGNTFSNVNAVITGLTPNTVYSYQIIASNSLGIVAGAPTNFITPALVPAAITGTATSVSSNSATLNATVNPGYAVTGWYFQYGPTTNYGSFTPTNTLTAGSDPASVSNVVASLTPGQTYYFKVVATNSAGTDAGTQASFSTPALVPIAITGAATSISSTNATLNASINPGYASTGWYFQYGPTTNYGSFTPTNTLSAGSVAVSVSNVLAGLTPGQAYYYQAVAVNSAGTNAGLHASFSTLAIAPVAITGTATSVTSSNATLNASINPGYASTTWYFRYGTTTNYGSFTVTNTLGAGSNAVSVSNVLSGLNPGGTYYYQIVAANDVGTNAGSQSNFLASAIGPAAVTGAATNISQTNATLLGTINPGGAATSYYFQYGTSTNLGSFTLTNSLPAGNASVEVTNALTNLVPGAICYYQIVAVNGAGTGAGAELSFTNLNSSVVITNSEIVVAITSPANNFSTTNSGITIAGTIKGGTNSLLQVTVNTNAPALAVIGAASHGFTAWSYTATLAPGLNEIMAQTVVTNGPLVVSIPAAINVFYLTNVPASSNKSSLTVSVSPVGSGKITGETSGTSLELNKVFTVKATANNGWIFHNWSLGAATNDVLGSNASLSFIMSSNLSLQANFVTNPFPAVAGVYNGLFSPAAGAAEESSGFFSATIAPASSGAYTAKLILDGGSYSFAGSFDLSGDSEATVERTGLAPLEVILHLNLNLAVPDNQMTGSVVNFGTPGWTSALLADRAVFSKSSPTTNYAGKYTMVIPPGSGAPAASPGGYSYATLTGTSAGVVTLTGSLADNTAISQSVPVSQDGNIPLYVSLYSKKGVLTGWLTFTNAATNGAAPAQLITGTNLAWIKTNLATGLYSTGFTNTNLTAFGSIYTGNFTLTNGTLALESGNLSSPLVFSNSAVADGELTTTNTAVKGTITSSTGVLTLTFPSEKGAKVTAKGVILQTTTGASAAGWFPGTNESGSLLLQP